MVMLLHGLAVLVPLIAGAAGLDPSAPSSSDGTNELGPTDSDSSSTGSSSPSDLNSPSSTALSSSSSSTSDLPQDDSLTISQVDDVDTCQPLPISWQWSVQGVPDDHVQAHITIAPASSLRKRSSFDVDERFVRRADKRDGPQGVGPPEEITPPEGVPLHSGQWTWPKVNVPAGTYTIRISHDDPHSPSEMADSSLPFLVHAGSDVSCLAPVGAPMGVNSTASQESRPSQPVGQQKPLPQRINSHRSGGDGGSSAGKIAPAVIVPLLVLGAIGLLLFCQRRRRRSASNKSKHASLSLPCFSTPVYSNPMRAPSTSDRTIPHSNAAGKKAHASEDALISERTSLTQQPSARHSISESRASQEVMEVMHNTLSRSASTSSNFGVKRKPVPATVLPTVADASSCESTVRDVFGTRSYQLGSSALDALESLRTSTEEDGNLRMASLELALDPAIVHAHNEEENSSPIAVVVESLDEKDNNLLSAGGPFADPSGSERPTSNISLDPSDSHASERYSQACSEVGTEFELAVATRVIVGRGQAEEVGKGFLDTTPRLSMGGKDD